MRQAQQTQLMIAIIGIALIVMGAVNVFLNLGNQSRIDRNFKSQQEWREQLHKANPSLVIPSSSPEQK